MNFIWALGLTDFIIYSVLNITLSKLNKFHILWDINFAQQLIIIILFLLSAVMFLMTLIRVVKIQKQLNIPENAKMLWRWRKIIGISFLGQILFVLFQTPGLYLQGYYGPWARIQSCTLSTLVLLNEMIFFILIVGTHPDVTLSTKVLNDHRLVLVGIDHRNYERFKLYIPRNADNRISNRFSRS